MVAIMIVGLALMTNPAAAQARDPADGELWTALGLRLKMPQKLSATLTQHLRMDEGMSRLDVASSELALRYRPSGWWQIEGGYRYEREHDNDAVFQDRHRFFANTRFERKFEPLKLQLRIQWQEQLRDERDDGTPTRHILRTRAKLALRKVPGIDPYASVEIFQRLDGQDRDVPSGTVQKLRFKVGFERRIGKIELDARYGLVVPIHDERDPLRHIVSVGLRLDLAPWKKKKKDES
jgi:hypothetical protein